EQVDDSMTREFGGLGLGLAISKAVIDMHGGHITARSDGPGCGATVTIELRTAAASRERAGNVPVRPPGADYVPRRDPPVRVLIVEDHADTSRVLSRLL